MRWFVEVGGREHVVSVESRPDGSLAVEVGGRAVAVQAEAHGARELTVHVGERVLDLTLEGAPPDLGVIASGRRTYVRVESERTRAAQRATGSTSAAKERDVRSPMPGRVVKLLVAPGDEVAAGQPVAIVEAMKMENEVRAKRGGVVAKLHQQPGATVESNAVLISFVVDAPTG